MTIPSPLLRQHPIIKKMGLCDYADTWEKMQRFTLRRTDTTPDEIWLIQHPPVFTQGLNGKAGHLLSINPNIPLVQTDRGGQVTYHAPGQLIAYVLIDLKRHALKVRQFVHDLETVIIQTLAHFNIQSQADPDAPGVYVQGQKIASLGIKVRKQCTYHGLAINVDMDLTPFQQVNPCGLVGMQMTQVITHQPTIHYADVEEKIRLVFEQYFTNLTSHSTKSQRI